MKKDETYCSYCLKPCLTITQQDRISDEFGIQVHPPYQISHCCGDEVYDRRRAIQLKWSDRKFSRVSTNLHPIFEAILEGYYRRVINE